MSTVRIKISYPKIWLQYGHWDYLNLTQDGKGRWDNYQFFVNDNNCTECDFWIIHESLDVTESVTCPWENIILIPSEEISQKATYNQKYADQFSAIFTSRSDIQNSNVSRGLYLCAWQVQKTYQELVNLNFPEKHRILSSIVSNNRNNEGHRQRYNLMNELKGHFKNNLDWYAKGENFIADKWDGWIDYQYSIAIENSRLPYYFTEKLMDCYLAFTMPIYLGGTNMKDFYPEQSYIDLEKYDYLSFVEIIENAIANNLAEKNRDAIMEARNLVLKHYQFIPLLIDYIEKNQTQWSNVRIKNKIHPIEHFTNISVFKRAISFSIRKVKNI
jgi:hypothetical protein